MGWLTRCQVRFWHWLWRKAEPEFGKRASRLRWLVYEVAVLKETGYGWREVVAITRGTHIEEGCPAFQGGFTYYDPAREHEAHALPDLEVFQVPEDYALESEPGVPFEPGWYYWTCLPGCLPDSDAWGPFDTAQDAQDDARGGGAW